MTLNDLEFKPEDFDPRFPPKAAMAAAVIANRILREKLAKTPQVFGSPTEDGKWVEEDPYTSEFATHRARSRPYFGVWMRTSDHRNHHLGKIPCPRCTDYEPTVRKCLARDWGLKNLAALKAKGVVE